VPEIFQRDGEAFFRKRESEVIARLLKQERCILSTGGGAFLAESNREMISRDGVSLWLNADLPLLWQRVRHKESRPLLRTPNPYATLAEIYRARVPVYEKADISVTCQPSLSIEAMASRVIAALAEQPDVLENQDA
jgi:shikimate kinase